MALTKRQEIVNLISHELKTPTVPILGYCEMLVNSKLGSLSTDQNEAVKEIQQNTIQLNHLIFDFWNAQQLDLGKMKYFYEDVNVNELIKHLERDLSNLIIGKNIEFSKLVESEIHITADESKLFEIFKNLIENSSNFVPEIGGKIQISVKPDDSFVQFSVEDNGSGIAKEKMNLLFKKFHQIDTSHRRVHSGGGLGLTICKGYIEDMGGKIWAKSEIDIGTTFFFTLPKNQGEKL